MQIVIHTGAHFTDEDRLLKCVMRNTTEFAGLGIAVPGPGRYRGLLKKTLNALKSAPPSPEAREVLLDAILDDAQADRMILSNTNFFGAPRASMRHGAIYPMADSRVAGMSELFPHDQIEMFIGIRNPASFLPAIFKHSPQTDFEAFTGGVDPRHIRWSETLTRVRQAAPNVGITVWCNEDTPLIWEQIVREMAGLDPGAPIIGRFDLLREIMSDEGMKRLESYVAEHPELSEMQLRRVISAFLDKFALEDQLEEELDLPDWDEDFVEELTEIYDEDVFRIQRIPGVYFIEP
ncbi:MAG: hypothetical protein AB3N23_08240 [Paracoccaceae bacterium]